MLRKELLDIAQQRRMRKAQHHHHTLESIRGGYRGEVSTDSGSTSGSKSGTSSGSVSGEVDKITLVRQFMAGDRAARLELIRRATQRRGSPSGSVSGSESGSVSGSQSGSSSGSTCGASSEDVKKSMARDQGAGLRMMGRR